ncbi:MAG: hypothetical protein RL326_168 [Pseudomonadota bacterium]
MAKGEPFSSDTGGLQTPKEKLDKLILALFPDILDK